MEYLYVKALHIIFIITWFAGLFYIVRLFIYFAEADTKSQPEKDILQKQYKLMSKRLWFIITWPSGILATIFGIWLFTINPVLLELPWMKLKLGFVFLLFIYHGTCHYIFNQQQKGASKFTSQKLRIWNEVATLILFSVVFLVILKNAFNWIYGVLGIIVLMIVLMIAIKLYKKSRLKNDN